MNWMNYMMMTQQSPRTLLHVLTYSPKPLLKAFRQIAVCSDPKGSLRVDERPKRLWRGPGINETFWMKSAQTYGANGGNNTTILSLSFVVYEYLLLLDEGGTSHLVPSPALTPWLRPWICSFAHYCHLSRWLITTWNGSHVGRLPWCQQRWLTCLVERQP